VSWAFHQRVAGVLLGPSILAAPPVLHFCLFRPLPRPAAMPCHADNSCPCPARPPSTPNPQGHMVPMGESCQAIIGGYGICCHDSRCPALRSGPRRSTSHSCPPPTGCTRPLPLTRGPVPCLPANRPTRGCLGHDHAVYQGQAVPQHRRRIGGGALTGPVLRPCFFSGAPRSLCRRASGCRAWQPNALPLGAGAGRQGLPRRPRWPRRPQVHRTADLARIWAMWCPCLPW
jgi:hypothetical protein